MNNNRIEFIQKQYNIVSEDEYRDSKKNYIGNQNGEYTFIEVVPNEVFFLCYKTNKNKTKNKNITISNTLFEKIIDLDPTQEKSYVQWTLNAINREIKYGTISSVKELIINDIPSVRGYIECFEANKNKQSFRKLCEGSDELSNVKYYADINQYKSLSELFNAVEPFLEKSTEVSNIESTLNRFVSAKQAILPLKTSRYTIYIPLTHNASRVFESYTNWCTTKTNSSSYKSYTNQLTPDGKKSKLYIIINNKFFSGDSKEIYQVHFESNQIKNRSNSDFNIDDTVFSLDLAVRDFFKNELVKLSNLLIAKGYDYRITKYSKLLFNLNMCDGIVDLIHELSPSIMISNKKMGCLPNLNRFKNLTQLILVNCQLGDINLNNVNYDKLQILSLPKNQLTKLPIEIGNFKSLVFINLNSNPIKYLPEEITLLDKSNGGSLEYLSIDASWYSENRAFIKKYLPNVIVNYEK